MNSQAPKLTIKPYWGVDNTLRHIRELVLKHYTCGHLAPFDGASLAQIFDYVRRIPYVKDPNNFEWLQSPYRTLQLNHGDCDDKSILLGAIFHRKGIPYRMAVVSNQTNQDLHHIYPEIFIQGMWLPFDATYSYNQIYTEKPWALKRIYDWRNGQLITYEFKPDSQKAERVRTLAGDSNMAGENIRLAILEGNNFRNRLICGCGYNRSNCRCGKNNFRTRRQLARHYVNTINGNLGIDPATITAVVSVISTIFSWFGGSQYTDAYHVWQGAESRLAQLSSAAANGQNATAAQELAVNRALIAVLSRDIMNPPMGANLCTSSGRCGNRAEWDVIKSSVEQKVAAFAPFMLWLHFEMWGGRIPPGWGLESLVQYYDMFKNGTGYYPQFQTWMEQTGGQYQQEQQNNGGQFQQAGGSALLWLGLAGVAIYFIATKKKGRK